MIEVEYTFVRYRRTPLEHEGQETIDKKLIRISAELPDHLDTQAKLILHQIKKDYPDQNYTEWTYFY